MLKDIHVLESIPAFALGSLEDDEARLVAEHLAGCYLCRKELAAYQHLADQLLLGLPEVKPPVELKSRLVERVQGLKEKQVPWSAGWRLRGQLRPVGVLAAVLVILILAVSNAVLWMRAANAEIITGPLGMRAIALQNTAAAPGASGFVIVGADGKNGVLVVDKLPALGETQEYQVWLMRDSTETSGAVFSVDEDGYRGMRLVAPQSLLTYSSVQVTIEPAGGSTNPTGPQVLNGSLFNSGENK